MSENFNLGNNIWTVSDGDFKFGMYNYQLFETLLSDKADDIVTLTFDQQ